MTPRRTRESIILAVCAGAVGFAACTSVNAGPDNGDAAPTAVDSPSTPISVQLPPVTEPATTTLPVTTQPATTASTVPPTTESTAPPTTIDPTLQVVGAWPEPLVAVGTSSGEATAVIQYRLIQLGFWVAAVDGQYGLTTKQAVMAFQKYMGLPATGAVDADTAVWLQVVTDKARGEANDGTLIEINKSTQLLFIIRDGKTEWVLNVSTGSGLEYEEADQNTPGETIKGVSLTPSGVYEVDRERPEGWWEGDLGEIYRPKYFRGGIAVHGSNSIPNYPASHGCVRVSVPAMDWIWEQNFMPIGTTVWVHGQDLAGT